MSTKVKINDLSLEEVQVKIENYRTTILALEAFISLITWDIINNKQIQGSRFSIGRRMDTSSTNKISQNCTVTPDAVIQREINLGYIVEIKKSLPKNQNDNWQEVIDQLVKYDDDLLGWWTDNEMISIPCPVLLLHISRSADFGMYLDSLINGKKLSFDKSVSIVEFDRSQQVKEFIFLRLQWGKIENSDVLKNLKSGREIPVEKVLANPIYGEKKFCDFEPCPEHTMYILWNDIFTGLKQKVEYDQKLRAYPLRVNAEVLTLELQKLFGAEGNEPRQITYPRTEWIRNALDCFVKIGSANKIDDNGNYLILFKLIKQNLLEIFRKWRDVIDSNEIDKQEIQPHLFETDL